MTTEDKTPILIYGPTASGKSAAALALAQQLDGIVVNADALQVYNAYDILTARPSLSDLQQARHTLYGYVDDEMRDYSVGVWLRDLQDLLARTTKRPIIVGGTGLYFRAAHEGLAAIPEIPNDTHDKIELLFRNNGLQYLVNVLTKVDPLIIERIDLQNPRRVMRAIAVFEATGKPLSQWQAETPAPLITNAFRYVLSPNRDDLRARIAKRADAMWQMGALAEVAARNSPFDPKLPANKAIGAREIAAYLNDELGEDEAKSALIVATQQYAKRQRSWARANMSDWNWAENTDDLVADALRKIPMSEI